MDAFFPSPLFALSFFYSFLLQGLTRGHFLGLVAKADSVTDPDYFRHEMRAEI
jgi:hypothetical protein